MILGDIIRLPVNANEINGLYGDAIESHGPMIRDAIAWIMSHNSDQAVLEGIRNAWRQTSLVLPEWAEDIEKINVVAVADGIQLDIQFKRRPEFNVRQSVPIRPDRLEQLIAGFPHPLPPLMCELALSAPGLCLENTGLIAEPRYYYERLGSVSRWFCDVDKYEIARLGFKCIDHRLHLMEVASNNYGDCYLVGTDGAIWFFDHEVPGLVSCAIHLDQLLEQYLASPEVILDPYESQWAILPKDRPLPMQPRETLYQVLARRTRELPFLAGIAYAIRGCRRALPDQCIHAVPPKWRRDHETLLSILDECKTTALTGVPLRQDTVQRMQVLCQDAMAHPRRIVLSDTDYSASFLTCYAMPALIRACALVADHNYDQVWEAIVSCGNVKTRQFDIDDAVFFSAITDIDYIVSLDLGQPRTLGKPVPSGFFERPLWSS